MGKLNKPVKNKVPLREIFIAEAIRLGCSAETADALFHELPEAVQFTYAEKIGFEEDPPWRYRYGKLFDINGRPGLMMPLSTPLVSDLVRAIIVAKKHLRAYRFIEWLERIKDQAKHFDALFEMLVVSHLSNDHVLHYEKRGSGLRDKSIDWLLETSEISFYLEVKARQGQIAKQLEYEFNNKNKMPHDPIPDIEKLFTGVASKFRLIDGSNKIQGAALFLSLLIPKEPFLKHFSTHYQDKLHFVALVKEDGHRVHISARSDEIKTQVLTAFNWIEGGDYFIDES